MGEGWITFSSLIGLAITFVWLLGVSYTTSLLDGLDGLVAGLTVIGALVIYLVSLSWDVPASGTSYLALLLAGAAAGVLIFNWHPAKIFLGEGGSLWCGFMLGVLAIISGSKVATALLVLGVPAFDVFLVILQRLIKKQKIFSGDGKHLHFLMLRSGLSHRGAVLTFYLIAAGFGLASLYLSSFGKVVGLILLAILTTGLVINFAVKESRGII